MKTRQILSTIMMLVLLLMTGQSGGVEPGEPGTHDGPPRIEMLKEPAVFEHEGTYYLTGTAGTYDKSGKVDFDYNRGAPFWKSKDLKEWESLGYVFDRAQLLARNKTKIAFWRDWNAPSERIDALLAQATTSPKVYHFGTDWFMVCAMNDQAILLQKSESGNVEGPYEDYAVLATRGGYPSIFADSDGTRYLVFADAWIAKLKPDMTALDGEIRPLRPAPAPDVSESRLTLGERGTSLFKHDGKYFALATRWQVRDGKASHDAVLWSADSVYGPYRETGTVLPDAGHVTVFQDAKGAFKAIGVSKDDGSLKTYDITIR